MKGGSRRPGACPARSQGALRLCDTFLVKFKPSAWLLIVVVAVVCAAAVWGVAAFRSRDLSPGALLKRVPMDDSVIVYVNFASLRRTGVLQLLEGTPVAEEPEYQSFVRKTEFNYRQDLDSALIAFAPAGKFILAKGRFEWRSLQAYVGDQGGSCYNSLCLMAGSTPERHISFFPLQPTVMAMAVSSDTTAALRLQNVSAGPAPETPNAPVWVSIPGSLLRSRDALPEGTRVFARSMESADNLLLTFAPEGARIAARLILRCRNEQDAAATAAQLSRATAALREAVQRESRAPNTADLSGVLTAGTFRSEGQRVYGYWPIEQSFVTNVLGGSR